MPDPRVPPKPTGSKARNAQPALTPPPVHRPRATSPVAQPKGRPAPPPVYRPEAPKVAQARKASGPAAPAKVNAPPVYRPQPMAGRNAPIPPAPRQPAAQARMAASVIQRTVWEWDVYLQT